MDTQPKKSFFKKLWFILPYTKEFRDQNPCQLLTSDGVQDGQLNDRDHPEDWVYLH
ncbi:MAG: hypothetical protein V1685_07175 [Parcubacteria group bacterium]